MAAEALNGTFIFDFYESHTTAGMTTAAYNRQIFYNNFFISRVQFWMQPHVKAWLRFLEATNGYQKFRWGDAAIHTLTLGMFMPRSEVVELGFDYDHGGRLMAGQYLTAFRHVPGGPKA